MMAQSGTRAPLRWRTFLLGGSLGVLVLAAAVLWFGRHGEFAIAWTMPDPVTIWEGQGVSLDVEGAILRGGSDPDATPVVWASRPEFSVRVLGASPNRPVRIANAPGPSAYEPLPEGVTAESRHWVVTAPGEYRFRLRANDTYSFLVMGDPQRHPWRLEAALRLAPDAVFALCIGDLAEKATWEEMQRVAEIAEESPLPVYFTVGNHDVRKGGRRHYRKLFGEENYAFSVGPDRFVVLDTAASHPYVGDHRADLLEQALALPGTRFRFVFFHVPLFDPRPGPPHALTWGHLRDEILGTLSRYSVDLAFSGHIHEYLVEEREGVRLVITGGLAATPGVGGGIHVVRVDVAPVGVSWQVLSVPAS